MAGNDWWELKGGGRRMRGNWGISSWRIVVYARCAGSQTEGPTALEFSNIQEQLLTTYSNQSVSAKATSREVSQNCLLPDKAGCVTVLATFLQLSNMHFLGG